MISSITEVKNVFDFICHFNSFLPVHTKGIDMEEELIILLVPQVIYTSDSYDLLWLFMLVDRIMARVVVTSDWLVCIAMQRLMISPVTFHGMSGPVINNLIFFRHFKVKVISKKPAPMINGFGR